MPNWCDNYMEIRGDIAEIKSLIEKNNNEFNFSLFVPQPVEALFDKKFNWYDWNLENWGTKWEPSIAEISIEENLISIDFETAWGPPDEFIKNFAKKYPKAEIYLEYDEPGGGYLGKINACGNNFEILEEEDYEHPKMEYELVYILEQEEEE